MDILYNRYYNIYRYTFYTLKCIIFVKFLILFMHTFNKLYVLYLSNVSVI